MFDKQQATVAAKQWVNDRLGDESLPMATSAESQALESVQDAGYKRDLTEAFHEQYSKTYDLLSLAREMKRDADSAIHSLESLKAYVSGKPAHFNSRGALQGGALDIDRACALFPLYYEAAWRARFNTLKLLAAFSE